MTTAAVPAAPVAKPRLVLGQAITRAIRTEIGSVFERCYEQCRPGGYPYPAFDLYQFTLELVGLRRRHRRTKNRTEQFERYYAAVVEAAQEKALPLPSPRDVEAWVDELLRRVRDLHWLGVRRAGYNNSYLIGPLYHYEPVVRRSLLAPVANA
jgi:hypothetical protein